MWGWRLSLAPSDEPAETFPCVDLCRKAGSLELLPRAQAAMNCALPRFDRRAWTGAKLLPIYLGAAPRYDLEGQDAHPDWREPNEDIEHDGCPGAWYRSPFVESVLRYRRRPCGDGMRLPNRLLDLCDDELVIEAVNAMEVAEDSWRGEYQALQLRRMRERGHG